MRLSGRRLVRDIIKVRSVRHQIHDDVGYIRITTFNEQTMQNLREGIAEVKEKIGEDKVKGFVVLLTDDADAGAGQLKKVAEEKGIKHVPLTVFDGKTGPDAYKISKDAAVTVVLWNKSKVTANHAFAEAKLSDDAQKAVVADAKKLIGG